MPTIVRLHLRHDTYADQPDKHGDLVLVPGYAEDVDLDQLTPRARALAECIAACPGGRPLDIWMEHDRPIREVRPDWQLWYSDDEASRPERRPWRGWSRYPATSHVPAIQWLEEQARKIPPDWHPLGADPHHPVPSRDAGAADRYLTRDQVMTYMRARGRDISVSTWDSYRARKPVPLAPPPDRYVSRTPQWLEATIDRWLSGEWKPDLRAITGTAEEARP